MAGLQECGNSVSQWNFAVRAVCGPYETEVNRKYPKFVGDVASGTRGGLPFARLRTNAARVRRCARGADRDNDQRCVLLSQSIGQARVVHDGFTYHLMPGDIVLLDSAGECEIEPKGLIEHMAISLPKPMVARHISPGRSLQGMVDLNSTSGRLLRLLLAQLSEEDQKLSELEQHGVLSAILCLLGSALQNRSEQPSKNATRRTAAELRVKAEVFIQNSIASPDLSPALIASALNVSLRQLYRSFEEVGGSVYRYILASRLRHCALELTATGSTGVSITDVAYKWGFSDSASFSRAFKRHFGLAPREYRMVFCGHNITV
ncbi:Transcriptional activator FeaR [compost metagenome]